MACDKGLSYWHIQYLEQPELAWSCEGHQNFLLGLNNGINSSKVPKNCRQYLMALLTCWKTRPTVCMCGCIPECGNKTQINTVQSHKEPKNTPEMYLPLFPDLKHPVLPYLSVVSLSLEHLKAISSHQREPLPWFLDLYMIEISWSRYMCLFSNLHIFERWFCSLIKHGKNKKIWKKWRISKESDLV